MSNRVEERLQIEVLQWNKQSNSFTTSGGIRPNLERLIEDRVRIRLLVLIQGGKQIAEIPNVHLRASHANYHYPPVDKDSVAAAHQPSVQQAEFEYERLDV